MGSEMCIRDSQSSYRKWCLEEYARAGPLESSLDFQRLVVLIKLYSKHFPTETPPKAVPVKPEQLPKGWPVEPDAPSFTPGRGIKKEEVKSEARGSTEGNLLHRILRRQQARPVSPDKVPVGTGDSSEELLDDSPPAWPSPARQGGNRPAIPRSCPRSLQEPCLGTPVVPWSAGG